MARRKLAVCRPLAVGREGRLRGRLRYSVLGGVLIRCPFLRTASRYQLSGSFDHDCKDVWNF